MVKEFNNADHGEGAVKADIVDEVVLAAALYARAQISPLVSFWGGIIA